MLKILFRRTFCNKLTSEIWNQRRLLFGVQAVRGSFHQCCSVHATTESVAC